MRKISSEIQGASCARAAKPKRRNTGSLADGTAMVNEGPIPVSECPYGECSGNGHIWIEAEAGHKELKLCRCKKEKMLDGQKRFFVAQVRGQTKREPVLSGEGVIETDAIKKIRNYLPNQCRGRWVTLCGPVGCGKTYALSALVCAVLDDAFHGLRAVWSATYVPWPACALAWRTENGAASDVNDILNHDVIFIDEAGREHQVDGSTYMPSLFDHIVRTGQREHRILFIASNLPVDQFCYWAGRGSESILRQEGQIIAVKGDDLRRRR